MAQTFCGEEFAADIKQLSVIELSSCIQASDL